MRATIIAMVAALASACSDQIYEVPSGYKGWVEVDLTNPACSPLQTESGSKVVRIESNGHGCTSEDLPAGLNRARYYFVADGKRERIPRDIINGQAVAEDHVAGRSPRKYLVFFIGPKSEMKGFGLLRDPIQR